MDAERDEVELMLEALKPRGLSSEFLDRLEAAMDGAAEAALEEKVVAFPVADPGVRRSRPVWGAAAAVALLGAAAALWLSPAEREAVAVTPVEVKAPSVTAAPVGGQLVTAGYGRDVREASDEGVVWSQDQVPHRRVRVVYVDKAVMTTAEGETIEVERPRVEWLLVPEPMD